VAWLASGCPDPDGRDARRQRLVVENTLWRKQVVSGITVPFGTALYHPLQRSVVCIYQMKNEFILLPSGNQHAVYCWAVF